MKKIIVAVVVLLLLGGGAGAFFLLPLGEPPADGEAAQAGQQVAPEPEPDGEALYLPLDPAFVVNFEYNGGIRYLQISLQVMAYEPSVLEKVAAHMPAVRNNLILLFSGQDYPTLNTVEGKEALRGAVRESVNKQLKLKGESRVRDVFFTGFVVQ